MNPVKTTQELKGLALKRWTNMTWIGFRPQCLHFLCSWHFRPKRSSVLYRVWYLHTSYFWKSSVLQGSNHETGDKTTIIYLKEWTSQQLASRMNAFSCVSNLKSLLHTVPYIWASAGSELQDNYNWYLTWISSAET